MRFQFFLMPAAIIATAPAVAADYMTVQQAQQALFPGASFKPADVNLTEAQVKQLIQESKTTVYHSRIKAWKVSTGGWFILDQVPGRDDVITYAVGLDNHGAVTGIEVLVCTSGYDNIRDHKWLDLFNGKSHDVAAALTESIPIVSGTSLSSTHITEGVKRVVTTYALVLAAKAG